MLVRDANRRSRGSARLAPSTEALLAAAVLAALAAPAPAQTVFGELGKRYLPPDLDDTHAVARGDVDGDGNLDLVIGNYGSQNRLYLGDGVGHFVDGTAARLPADSDRTAAVALGDVDGDGDLDLVCGNGAFGDQSRLYLNDGSGRFTDVTAAKMPVDNDRTLGIALGDVDGDGDLDLVLANGTIWPGNSGQDRLYLNDGTGGFTDATATRLPVDTKEGGAAAFGDVDGDGDLDLVIGNWSTFSGQQNALYLNDGTGTFTDATATRMPVDTDDTLALAFGDVDGDGDLDLVCGNGKQNRLYANDGAGRFTDATAGRLPAASDYTHGVALGDVDGDGDLDLVVANSAANRLYRNDGTGVFADVSAALPADLDYSRAVVFGDVDGDGDLDVVFGNRQQDALSFNDGSGVFLDAVGPLLPRDGESTTAVVFGDVDGDGDLDLVLGTHDRATNHFYRNDGRGRFIDETRTAMPVSNDRTEAVAMGDVDGDGDLDVVVGTGFYGAEQNRLYLNDDGKGRFADLTARRMPVLRDRTLAVVLGDVDGDGDLDLVTGNGAYYTPEQNRLYLNDGGGTFTDATTGRLPTLRDYTRATVLGDVDGDGDLDLVIGNTYSQQNRLYRNDGTGHFADVTGTQFPIDRSSTEAAAFGDFDGDGDLDLVFANSGQNRLYLNDDGNGHFADLTAARMPVDSYLSFAVVVGDVDEDGDLDLVFGNAGQDRVYLNDGTGRFTDATASWLSGEVSSTGALALGDVDADGDLDLVVGSYDYGTTDRLYSNLRRHLDAPQLAILGRTYRLDVYSRTGVAGPAHAGYPFLATAAAAIPVPPFGTLGLDPTQMLVLPPLSIPQPAGTATLSFTVPPTPAIAGVPLFAQALVVTGNSVLLSNVTRDPISR